MTELICQNEQRRESVRRHRHLNGLDYLEVGADRRTLTVYFLGKAPVELDKSQVRIEGGRRIRDIRVEKVQVQHYDRVELDDYLEVVVDREGDFSTYTLRVIEQNEQGEWQPHSAFDPRYDRVDFSFKVDCPSDLDCKQQAVCPPEKLKEPDINYLAKDYASFRQLILDRLALLMPDWQERHVPDIGVALVEVLAYVGDHLSYYQDAVATEAYLSTARRRISVRRHARLVDYPMHEGCNARAWVCIETDTDLPLNLKDTYFITGFNEALQVSGRVLAEDDLQQVPSEQYEIFEPISRYEIQLYRDHSRLRFYTWGDKECCLPRGTTRATLVGELLKDTQPETPHSVPDDNPKDDPVALDKLAGQHGEAADKQTPKLHLQPGDVLVFEEVKGPETGHPGDADPRHRHAVRLTRVTGGIDPLDGQSVVEISWSAEDALPFPLCLSSLGPPPECRIIENVSIAWGNVILADHGQTRDEDLGTVAESEIVKCCKGEGVLADTTVIPEDFRPQLQYMPMTFSQPLAPLTPASKSLMQEVWQALPQVVLKAATVQPEKSEWLPRADLFASGPDDQHFVAEIDNDGRAHLRFGDDESGEKPDAGTTFQATYRIGNGVAGNVGAGAISHLVLRKTQLSSISLTVRNPLPAQGGTKPEPMAEVRLFAPHRFRKDLQRAIIADDYAAIVQREFKDQVQRAAAQLRWTGSWHEVLVSIDSLGREEADPDLLVAVTRRLHRYRRMGHDLVVKPARRVPLDIELMVCVLPNYLRGHIKAVLLDLFGNRILPNGRKGFFHPDNLTFGEGIFVSRLVAVAQAVEGVESVQVKRLQRLNEPANHEIENGILSLGPFEIARLDGDPSFPENGRLTLVMGGGR